MTATLPTAPTRSRLRDLVAAQTVDEVLWEHQDRARFLVEGLIHATTTLVYGLTEAGKSWLMVDLVAALVGGDSWLGQPVNGGPRRCLVLAADAGGKWEYADRIGDGFGADMLLGTPPAVDLELWKDTADEAVCEDVGVVVVDNLYAWAGAVDMNSNAEVARPLACLGALAHAGLAVVLVHHTNSGGNKPAGVHSIPAFFRHGLKVTKTSLHSHGNDTADAHYRLTRDGGRVIHGELRTTGQTSSTSQAAAPATGRAKTQARYEEAVAALRTAQPPYSERALGRYLADWMAGVGSEDAGRGLVRAVRRRGMWSPPTDDRSSTPG
ncbi:AAA family ATPase [Geodermatophilus sp. SYSU D00742]